MRPASEACKVGLERFYPACFVEVAPDAEKVDFTAI
jgi:hypothetical protein